MTYMRFQRLMTMRYGLASTKRLIKAFQNLKGLDLRSSDLLRESGAATQILNADLRQTGALNKRKGFQILQNPSGGFGTTSFANVALTTGIITEELLTVDDDLHKMANAPFTITYTGSNTAYYDVYLDEGVVYFDVYDDNTRVLNSNLGTGLENSPVSVATLITSISSAVSNVSATVNGTQVSVTEIVVDSGHDIVVNDSVTIPLSGGGTVNKTVTARTATSISFSGAVSVDDDAAITGTGNHFSSSGSTATSTPAAFIPVQLNISIATGGGTDVSFKYWSAVDTPDGYTTPFSTHYAARNDSDFQNASFASVNDILLISNGYDDLHKYDGNRVYKAGMKQGAAPTATPQAPAAAGITGTFSYKYVYEYTDAKENLIYGEASPVSANAAPSAQDVDVVVQNVQETTGFNTDQAEVNGNQAGVTTITVATGNDLKVGDFVYLTDQATGDVIRRKVTASSDTSLTIEGTAVDVNNNDVISNIKISIYRTADGPGISFYLLKELTNDHQTASQSYVDSTTDGTLTANITFVDPVKPRSLPPKGRHIDVWRGQAIITGIRDDVNNVYYSDIDSAEYFPVDNSFLVTGQAGGKTTGVRSLDNTLYIFKTNSIFAITGDLGTDNFVVDNVSREGIGCAAHATIEELNGEVWFLSDIGVYSISTQGIKERSDSIKPKFQAGHPFVFSKATAFNWIDNDKYILCMPSISTISTEDYADSDTEVYVYDMHWGAWLQWDGIEPVGGMAEVDGRIYFISRELNSASSTVKQYLNRIHADGLASDYADHASAISFSYKSHWETLGEPSIYKKFLRIKMHSLDTSLNDFETDQFSVAVQTEHNYEPNTISSLTLDFSGGALGWGNGPWGNFPWGETRLPSLKSKLASQKAKAIRVIFTNSTEKENILISGYELEVVAPYSLEIKD